MVQSSSKQQADKFGVPKDRHPIFYRIMIFLGRTVYTLCSRSVEMNRHQTRTPGGLLLVANHTSPYDVPCLLQSSRRPLDFISLERFARMFFVGWFFRSLNVVFLRRGGDLADGATFKEVVKRLREGRAVAIFPEAEMRTRETSAIVTGEYYQGFGKLAVLGRAKVLPAVVLESINFATPTGWLPWPRTEWGVIYGEPIAIPEGDSIEAAAKLEQLWLQAIRDLEPQLEQAIVARFGERKNARPEGY